MPLNKIATKQTKTKKNTSSGGPPLGFSGHATRCNTRVHGHSIRHKNMAASAAEPEVGAAFVNAQNGHAQPETPLRTDKSTAFGILNETLKQNRPKAMGMRYHCLEDRVCQTQFDVYWHSGTGGYQTYCHSA
jgi:hypothetical protein